MAEELDLRLLRYFVAVAEELHFSRAAGRLFVAQQALSRDIKRLEQRVGAALLERTTRSVALTATGERLLVRARQLLSLHDETLRELRGETRSIFVDVVGERLTPAAVLAAARKRAEGFEFFARYHSGLDATLPLLATNHLDVTFGRWREVPGRATDGIEHRLIRLERIAVLLPEHHPLAGHSTVPLAALRDAEACWHCGDHASTEWEHVMRQLFAGAGADQTPPPRPNVRGIDELAYHVRQWDMPVLTISGQPAVPGAVVRPLVDPVAMYPWSMIWRRNVPPDGLDALHQAARELAAEHRWLDLPDDAWLPEPEATRQQAVLGNRR